MFKIFFTPQRRDDDLYISCNGSFLTINDQRIDFAGLDLHGDILSSAPSEWIVGSVKNIDGTVTLTILWPHGPGNFTPPDPIYTNADGFVYATTGAIPPVDVNDVSIDITKRIRADADLLARRAEMWEKVKIIRQARRQQGVFASGHWFHSDDTSRIQQIGLVMMGANIPAGLMWRTMDNGEVLMTQQLAGAIFQAIATSDAIHFQVAKDLRALIDLSNEPESVDINSGWPPVWEPNT